MGELKMKLTRQLLKEMVMREMGLMNESLMQPANIKRQVSRLISDFKTAHGAVQVAMITAENPPGGKPDMSNETEGFYWDNKMMQGYLRFDLDKLGYNYYPIIGDYGGLENSLMVVVKGNRDTEFKQNMIKLGKKYLQDAVVVGEKMASSQPNPNIKTPKFNMVFEMIMLHPTKTGVPNMDLVDYSIDDTRTKVHKGPDVQDRQEFFSKAGTPAAGELKFIVPFYSDEKEDEAEYLGNPFPVGE
jgi:hypothetical protein